MRAILLGPVIGNKAEQRLLFRDLRIRKDDILIGVDGGVGWWLKWGYDPDFAVGDWDSLKSPEKALLNIPHITLPSNKDRSDLYFAGVAAIEAGAQEIICLGVTGGRADHHLASLFELSQLSTGQEGRLKKVWAIGPKSEYHFLSTKIPSLSYTAKKGQLVSIFAMGEQANGVSVKGVKYPLRNATLTQSSLGLSNVVLKKSFQVRLRRGQLIVILPQDQLGENHGN